MVVVLYICVINDYRGLGSHDCYVNCQGELDDQQDDQQENLPLGAEAVSTEEVDQEDDCQDVHEDGGQD